MHHSTINRLIELVEVDKSRLKELVIRPDLNDKTPAGIIHLQDAMQSLDMFIESVKGLYGLEEVDGKGVLPQPSPNTADVVSGCKLSQPPVKELSPKDKIIQLIQSSGAALLQVQKLASAQNAMAMDLPVFKEMTVISKRLNEMMLKFHV